jgi:hypothetical protein
METYEAKARIWNIYWEGHEIRFEFLKSTIFNFLQPGHRMAIFFDGKRARTTCLREQEITVDAQGNDGAIYEITCRVFPKSNCTLQWPLSKSFWRRISDRVDRFLTSSELNAMFVVNGELIYLSHIGEAPNIEWAEIQKDLDLLEMQERTLTKGKIMVGSSKGWHKKKASKDELEQTKKFLANKRKELEARLSSWEAKNKRE